MAKKRKAAKKEVQEDLVEEITQDPNDNMSAEDVYAELAVELAESSPEQKRIAQLEAALAAKQAELDAMVPAKPEARPLGPKDKRLDEPVIPEAPNVRGSTDKKIAVHTYRELGVHPDDLDDGVNINPETGGITRSKFIKRTSGNLIEMP